MLIEDIDVVVALAEGASLTGATTPEALLEWMRGNLKYHGVNKGRVWTPQEVVSRRMGHCWETAELARAELAGMGHDCAILYLEDRDLRSTHSTVLYAAGGRHYWLEWAWGDHEGIHGPYRDRRAAAAAVAAAFAAKYGPPTEVRMGAGAPRRGGSEQDYIDMVRTWAPLRGLIQ